MNLEQKANKYGEKCDPCNETLEKQADIRQGFKRGYNECKSDIIDFLNANQKATVKQVLEHLNGMK